MCKEVILEVTEVSFIDKNSLLVISNYILDPTLSVAENMLKEVEQLIVKLTTLSQHWERLLFSTGGAINLQKSHWCLVQAAVLETILPKMHLNRHTPHAVLFAGLWYGGVKFRDKYTDMGYGQLCLFIGHLNLEMRLENFC